MELFEDLRIPPGAFFVRLDVRKASKLLRRRDEVFHSKLLEAFEFIRSRGLPAYLALAISDELNILFGDFFSRRLEKVVSLTASLVTLKLGMPVDARIAYTPSLLSAVKYLERRQVLGYRNALMKEAYERALERYKDPSRARSEASKPIDVLRREYSYYMPKRALLGTIARDEGRDSRDLRSPEGKKRLIKILESLPLEWSEKLVRNRASRRRCSARDFS